MNEIAKGFMKEKEERLFEGEFVKLGFEELRIEIDAVKKDPNLIKHEWVAVKEDTLIEVMRLEHDWPVEKTKALIEDYIKSGHFFRGCRNNEAGYLHTSSPQTGRESLLPK